MTARVAMLASVHIAKKEMHLADEDYRAIVKRITGKCSAGDCTNGQLGALLEEFRRLGWQKGMGREPKMRFRKSDRRDVRMIFAIWSDIRKIVPDMQGDTELRSFVRRQTKSAAAPEGIDAPEFLDAAQARAVIEGLKGWRARLLAKQEKCA